MDFPGIEAALEALGWDAAYNGQVDEIPQPINVLPGDSGLLGDLPQIDASARVVAHVTAQSRHDPDLLGCEANQGLGDISQDLAKLERARELNRQAQARYRLKVKARIHPALNVSVSR